MLYNKTINIENECLTESIVDYLMLLIPEFNNRFHIIKVTNNKSYSNIFE